MILGVMKIQKKLLRKFNFFARIFRLLNGGSEIQ